MGVSKFLYWPDPPGGSSRRDRTEVSLQQYVGAVSAPTTQMQQAVSTAWTQRRVIVQWGGVQRVRIRHRWGGLGEDERRLRRRLVAMINHLERGGTVLFAADDEYFFAGASLKVMEQDATSITVAPMFDDLVPDADMTGRELVIRSNNPACIIESAYCTEHTQGDGWDKLTITDAGLSFDYSDAAWVLVREAGSWPSLRMPESEIGREHLTTDGETAFTLDLLLEEDEGRLATLAAIAPDSEGTIIPGDVGGGVGGGIGSTGGIVAGTISYRFPT